jgi:single-strand DNA-binding protein
VAVVGLTIHCTWDRLAQTCGEFLGKGQQVAVEGRLQTRSWDDDRGQRHWKTEVVANHVEMLSGRRKKDYADASAANALAAQASGYVDPEEAAIAAAAEPQVEESELILDNEAETEDEGDTVAA